MKVISAFLATACLVAFLGVLVWHVPRLDLGLIIGVTALLAVADVLMQLRRKP